MLDLLNSKQMTDKKLLKKNYANIEEAAKIQSRIKKRAMEISYLFTEMNFLRGLTNSHNYKGGILPSFRDPSLYDKLSKVDGLHIAYKDYEGKMNFGEIKSIPKWNVVALKEGSSLNMARIIFLTTSKDKVSAFVRAFEEEMKKDLEREKFLYYQKRRELDTCKKKIRSQLLKIDKKIEQFRQKREEKERELNEKFDVDSLLKEVADLKSMLKKTREEKFKKIAKIAF